MSFLYPLLIAGVAAVALPIALHMIRRHTRDRVTFSSLLFLRPTSPRYRHRRNLEHIPLLLLRCLVVCLLAFAFARPFLVRSPTATKVQPDRRIVFLVDDSASMQREGMWLRAIEEAGTIMKDLGPSDRGCVMTFDRDVRPVMGFEQWAEMEPGQRETVCLRELSQRTPGWGGTDLGRALVAASEAIEDDEANDGRQSLRQIVLISDMQEGSDLDALHAYEWPERTQLTVRAIPCRGLTNASLQLLTDRRSPFASRDDAPRIRISNSTDAVAEHFELAREETGPGADVYVPPGHSVVVPVAAGPNVPTTEKLILRGDDHDFDNLLYVAPRLERRLDTLYIGDHDANDTHEMLYYLGKALGADGTLTSRITRRTGARPVAPEDVEAADAIVVTQPLDAQNLTAIRRYVEFGGMVLLVMKSAETVSALAGLTGYDAFKCQEASTAGYAMLGRLDFDHPALQPFADPHFADFTRIHFWQHRRVDIADCPEARVLAWFDNNDPAWFEAPIGRGRLIVWTSGWHPLDSDLALSSKFVPLLYSVLRYGGVLTDRPSQYFVGDPIPLPVSTAARGATLEIRRPDGSAVPVGAEQQVFTQTELPGIYTVVSSAGAQQFAVNLSPAESRTDPMSVEELERLGVRFEQTSDVRPVAAESVTQRLRFREMESQQKLWRWVLGATLIVLLIETWLGGRLTRRGPASEGEQP